MPAGQGCAVFRGKLWDRVSTPLPARDVFVGLLFQANIFD
jgi:hypothetical protein